MTEQQITEADNGTVEGTATEIVPAAQPVTVFGTDDPQEIMQRTADTANALKTFIKAQGLSKKIGQSDHIMVEGWQMLGMMLGCTAVVTETNPVDEGWEARAELRDRTGRVIGAGDGQCLKSESTWKSRDDYARRSMAQTRAIGKAFRSVLGFIAKAAGYQPAPAEEMPEPQITTDENVREHVEKSVKSITRARAKDVVELASNVGLTSSDLSLRLVSMQVEHDEIKTKRDAIEAVRTVNEAQAKALEQWISDHADKVATG